MQERINNIINKVVESLKEDEGLVLVAYDDATGKPLKTGDTIKGKITIGIGRNIQELGITEEEAEFLLMNDLARTSKELEKIFGRELLIELPDNVIVALYNMLFNLGYSRFTKFKKLIQAIKDKDFKRAREEAIDSVWCKQLPNRCKRVADLFYKEQ